MHASQDQFLGPSADEWVGKRDCRLRAAYANLTRILRGLLYQPHIFGPIIPATVRCGWRNRDVYWVVQTCLMQQRGVVVVVAGKMCWMQHFSAFSWCLTSLGCMFGDFDVRCAGCSISVRLDGV